MVRILLHNERDERYKAIGGPAGLLTFRTRELAEDYRRQAAKLFEEDNGWQVVEVREAHFKLAVLECSESGEYYERVNRERYDLLCLPATSDNLPASGSHD